LIKVRTHFTKTEHVGTINKTPGVGAVQEFANECNIHSIMDRMNRRQAVPITNAEAIFGDFTGVNDFHTANNKLLEIENQFMTLDPKVRKRFHNDPSQFLDFVMNADNKPEAINLGLIPEPATIPEQKEQSPS